MFNFGKTHFMLVLLAKSLEATHEATPRKWGYSDEPAIFEKEGCTN